MTTKYLTGAYPGGYTLSAAYTGLDIEATARVGGTGVYAASFATIQNDGVVNNTGSGYFGVRLLNGGSVTNGSSTDTSALISGHFYGVWAEAASTLTNFGEIVEI